MPETELHDDVDDGREFHETVIDLQVLAPNFRAHVVTMTLCPLLYPTTTPFKRGTQLSTRKVFFRAVQQGV
ncbi:hypothetical protein QCN29_07230 [Streptomyces sp. HNM0663]|uniref:Uncharacterized protein n=1 Tax=Streptomyces chengmaiensis TaxID=3040919 RepID=A0ABT6HL49_9ACTN|nr:hypothetical protein [Streptomyces chengmaiensis]MDH2388579.1 hypothetical protein [Streptomyces chengmaiensis]